MFHGNKIYGLLSSQEVQIQNYGKRCGAKVFTYRIVKIFKKD